MIGIILFLYGIYCIFRGGFHLLLGGPIGHVTGIDVGGFGTGCKYFAKAMAAFSLAAFCGLAEI